ncbi:LysR family transcriptional regulator [Epibacterium sp. SM1969]|uniref:LysR family transcriptional regulator n=1 Tax=Tritonibacter aquimaris TaxID=2663379 RepID=A0A844AS58_9RHOB|nr:LysR family transcriptional regulator [Tritonibacter aquimaris]MQY43913.1 LysR family transcriptional regulator [Tritonibacter aquimaris]
MQLDWDDIRIFLEVERTGRMNHAAKRMGVSHTTVARRLRQMEERAGCHLFEPTDAGLVLTGAGRAILQTAQDMEGAAGMLSDTLDRHNSAMSGRVRIGAPDGFGNAVLSQFLPQLPLQEPGFEIELVPVPSRHKLWRRDVDIAISLERPETGRLVMRKLIDYDLRLYASPALIDRLGLPDSRDALSHYPFVGYIDELLYTSELDFNHLLLAEPKVVYKATTVKAQMDAVLQGAGLGVLPCFMARGQDLVAVLPDDIGFSRTYWLLFPEDYKQISRIRRVSDFIYERTHAMADVFRFAPQDRQK